MSITRPDLIALAVASLAAARSDAPLEVRAFYAATAASALQQLEEQVRRLKLNLGAVEAELVRLGSPKRMTGAERTG
jgi:hypothetical protein